MMQIHLRHLAIDISHTCSSALGRDVGLPAEVLNALATTLVMNHKESRS